MYNVNNAVYLKVSTSLVAIPCLRWLIAVQTTFMPHFVGVLSAVQQLSSISSGIMRNAVSMCSATNTPITFFSCIYKNIYKIHLSFITLLYSLAYNKNDANLFALIIWDIYVRQSQIFIYNSQNLQHFFPMLLGIMRFD